MLRAMTDVADPYRPGRGRFNRELIAIVGNDPSAVDAI